MSADAFMELWGGDLTVEGETQDSRFKNPKAFEIFSFSWGVGLPSAMHKSKESKGKAEAGDAGHKTAAVATLQAVADEDVEFRNFTIKKPFDMASPDLFLACCKKTTFKYARLTFRKSGQALPTTYLQLDFSDVKVVSYELDMKPGASEDHGPADEENVSFQYASCRIEYIPQRSDGSVRGRKVKSFSRKTNEQT